jgi:hypothetical protein
MPGFSFEKISPPVRRRPSASTEQQKPRGLVMALLDRFVEARVKRRLRREKLRDANSK